LCGQEAGLRVVRAGGLRWLGKSTLRAWTGVSQALLKDAGRSETAPVSDFVNLLKSEADSKQLVLLAHGPRTGEPEALA
jgi:hypothetical protein